MKKIIKYLLIVLLIFPLYSCKDNKLNEFGITSKLENELINAVYEYGEYEDYGHPIESLEIIYYFGEIEGYHTYLCIAPYELNHLDVFIPYTFNTLDYYLYKNGEVFTLTYAVENNIITKESINYINSFLWLEENEKEKERVHSKENEIAINETLNEVYHEALGINTDNNKKLLYKYDFNYIEKYKGLLDKKYIFYVAIKKEEFYFPKEKKEIIEEIEFHYFDQNCIELFGALYDKNEDGELIYDFKCLSLQEAYDKKYLTKEDLLEIKQIAIEKGYIKNN